MTVFSEMYSRAPISRGRPGSRGTAAGELGPAGFLDDRDGLPHSRWRSSGPARRWPRSPGIRPGSVNSTINLCARRRSPAAPSNRDRGTRAWASTSTRYRRWAGGPRRRSPRRVARWASSRHPFALHASASPRCTATRQGQLIAWRAHPAATSVRPCSASTTGGCPRVCELIPGTAPRSPV